MKKTIFFCFAYYLFFLYPPLFSFTRSFKKIFLKLLNLFFHYHFTPPSPFIKQKKTFFSYLFTFYFFYFFT